MDKRQIWYEPHPVSAERKAELRAQGYRIIDAAFAPEGYAQPGAKSEVKAPAKNARGRKAEHVNPDGTDAE